MEKLRAFLEGLEMQNIEELMLITPVELKLIGTVMADEIRVLKSCASEPSVEADAGKCVNLKCAYSIGGLCRFYNNCRGSRTA